MSKLTPWFDGKLHSPVHDGWYDCKECNARHYFKHGLWYRNKKSLKDGPMLINKMHWRGLARPSLHSLLAQCDPRVPRSEDEQAWLDMAPVGREFGSPDYERLMKEDAAAADRSVAAIDDSLEFEAASNSRIDAMEIQKQIFGLIERDLARDIYIGKIIGFEHIEFEAAEVGEVIRKLQAYTAKLVNSESLVLETEFVEVFQL